MATSRDFDGRLRNLERRRSQADFCQALYVYHHHGALPIDPEFARRVVTHAERLAAQGRAMSDTIPDVPDPDPAATAQEG